jgi:hypothetical protein
MTVYHKTIVELVFDKNCTKYSPELNHVRMDFCGEELSLPTMCKNLGLKSLGPSIFLSLDLWMRENYM